MNPKKILREIHAYWKTVLVALVITTATAAVITSLLPRKYDATVTFYVSTEASGENAALAYQGGLLSVQQARTYANLATSNRVLAEVISAARLPQTTPTDLAKHVTSNLQPESVLFDVTVTENDATTAVAIANSLGTTLVSLSRELSSPPEPSNGNLVSVRMVEPAVPSDGPVSPSWLKNLGAAIAAGLLLGGSIAYARSRLDDSISSAERLAELASELSFTVLGTIDQLPNSEEPFRLAGQDAETQIAAEQYRRVRTNLQFVDLTSGPKSIVISSPLAGDGKSTTACNLAASLSASGYRTILLDADLRRPSVGKYLGTTEDVGLTNVLTNRVSNVEATQHTRSGGFDFLATGPLPPNPSELLGSARMRTLIDELKVNYDYVLLDSPPTLPVVDSQVLSSITDGIVLVVRSASTKNSMLADSVASIRRSAGTLYGVVLVGVSPDSRTRSSSYYYSTAYDSEGVPNDSNGQTDTLVRPASGSQSRPTPERRQPHHPSRPISNRRL